MADDMAMPKLHNKFLEGGMTPAEVVVYNLCHKEKVGEDVFEILSEAKSLAKNPHEELKYCLEVLKAKGFIVY